MQTKSQFASYLRAERRKYYRFPVQGEAVLFLLSQERQLCCRMVDLGIEGCCLSLEKDIQSHLGKRIEVVFHLISTSFRFAGILAWMRPNGIVGVQFKDMNVARRAELAEVLGGLRAEVERKKMQVAVDAIQPPDESPVFTPQKVAGHGKLRSRSSERRRAERMGVDLQAHLLLLTARELLSGRIVDLGTGGCRFRMDWPYEGGDMRRVEVSMMVYGKPLRLPAIVIRAYDEFTVGIRFVEVTPRKHEQLETAVELVRVQNQPTSKAR